MANAKSRTATWYVVSKPAAWSLFLHGGGCTHASWPINVSDGEHLTRHARSMDIRAPVTTKQPCLPPRGFPSVLPVLGGGRGGYLGHYWKTSCKSSARRNYPPEGSRVGARALCVD